MRRLLALLVVAAAGLAPLVMSDPVSAAPGDQPYSVPLATLDAALECSELGANPDKETVLLVHGTFTDGNEQFDWNWALLLAERDFDFCIVSYPNRGLDDLQVSAEYVARALEVIHQSTGRKVDVMGHSQGALLPRWAVKWFPQARRAADDLVLVAGPNHGTTVASLRPTDSGGPAAFHQFQPDSMFIEALNRDDETPGEIDYTSLYSTLLDELVQPDGNVPGETATAVLDAGIDDPRVANVTPQQLCPGRVVDHLTIGTNDLVSIDIVLDAFTNDGPADLGRLDSTSTCAQGLYADPGQLPVFLELLRSGSGDSFPTFNNLESEPELMPYARAGQPDEGSAAGPDDETASSETDETQASNTPGEAASDPVLPATGGRSIFWPAAGFVAVALITRRMLHSRE